MALNAAFLYDVTTFQPIRPFVKWSSVEKRFASKKGCSKEVEAVMPKARFLVTAAMALIGFIKRCQQQSFWLNLSSAATYNTWICDRPLRRPPNTLIYFTLVGVISPSRVRQEQGIDAASL